MNESCPMYESVMGVNLWLANTHARILFLTSGSFAKETYDFDISSRTVLLGVSRMNQSSHMNESYPAYDSVMGFNLLLTNTHARRHLSTTIMLGVSHMTESSYMNESRPAYKWVMGFNALRTNVLNADISPMSSRVGELCMDEPIQLHMNQPMNIIDVPYEWTVTYDLDLSGSYVSFVTYESIIWNQSKCRDWLIRRVRDSFVHDSIYSCIREWTNMKSVISRLCTSHVTHLNGSCHTRISGAPPRSHVPPMNESWLWIWILCSLMCMHADTSSKSLHMDALSHIWMSHVPLMTELLTWILCSLVRMHAKTCSKNLFQKLVPKTCCKSLPLGVSHMNESSYVNEALYVNESSHMNESSRMNESCLGYEWVVGFNATLANAYMPRHIFKLVNARRETIVYISTIRNHSTVPQKSPAFAKNTYMINIQKHVYVHT